MYIKKKTFVLIITYLAAAAIALGACSAALSVNGRAYRSTAVYGYEHAFGEVVTASKNLSEALHRGSYASGAEMSASVCADVYGNCLAAEMTMSALPFSTQELEQTARFVGVVGDYAHSLMLSGASEGFDGTARKSFAELYKTGAKLYKALSELQDEVNDGEVFMDEPENMFSSKSKSKLVSTAMLKLEKDFDELPALQYDGTYSKKKLPDCDNPISEKKAREIAAEFLELDEDKLKLAYRGENGSSSFEYEDGTVTVDGFGNVASFSSSRVVTGDMSSEDMEKAAEKFLADRGYEGMKQVSSERHGDVQSMRFECSDNGIRCESDCIKIAIAADTGGLYSFDATGHIGRHKSHSVPESTVTEDTAKAALPESLSVEASSMVYAETDGGRERLCYDFECQGTDGEKLRVLVDAESGTQYKIVFE